MPKGHPLIQDIVVIADEDSWRKERFEPLLEPEEREDTLHRLEKSIEILLQEANQTYEVNSIIPKTGKLNLDYMTRLSTNEFFFFTKEPLTLDEFERLMNHIYERAKDYPPGIQLILGSFFVKCSEDVVMNVVPCLTCGELPYLYLACKREFFEQCMYLEVPEIEGVDSFKNMIVKNARFSNVQKIQELPHISVDEKNIDFNLVNLFVSRTPRGTPYLTQIIVCIDYLKMFGKWTVRSENLQKSASNESRFEQLPLFNVLVSNSITPNPVNNLTHADPSVSVEIVRKGRSQKISEVELPIGARNFRKITVAFKHYNVPNRYRHKKELVRKHGGRTASTSSLVSSQGESDERIEEVKNKYGHLKGDALKYQILKDFKKRIESTRALFELEQLKDELYGSYEYKILKQPQGRARATRFFHLKTGAQKTLDDMFKGQKNYLSKEQPHYSSGLKR